MKASATRRRRSLPRDPKPRYDAYDAVGPSKCDAAVVCGEQPSPDGLRLLALHEEKSVESRACLPAPQGLKVVVPLLARF